MSSWRLIDLEIYGGYTNMAIDEAILQARIEERVPNTFRLYRWHPSCASIGRNQSMRHEVDIEACKRLGIDFVRRITGGGAVYHDYMGEITYSIVAKKENFLPMDIDETFRILCKGIIVALGDFGLNAEHGIHHCPSIFVKGRKISGNAQTIKKGVVLQHGTILLQYNPQLMYSILRVKTAGKKPKVVSSVYQKVTTLQQESQRECNFETIKNALIQGYQKALNTSFSIENLTEHELNTKEHLIIEKYKTDEWNFKL
ncbi:MAG: lipoate--protein ligase family protein [Candidatus Helarchaeota archaeon]|nr:lipoate--protein ligase family protein [Candidatus Helarchaeota archaeon]